MSWRSKLMTLCGVTLLVYLISMLLHVKTKPYLGSSKRWGGRQKIDVAHLATDRDRASHRAALERRIRSRVEHH